MPSEDEDKPKSARRLVVNLDAECAEILAEFKKAGYTDTQATRRAIKLLKVISDELSEKREIVSVPKGTRVLGGKTFIFL